MNLPEISRINRSRAARWHAGGGEWHASDWSNALGGEAGELYEAFMAIMAIGAATGKVQNTVKKVRRHETHVDRIATGQSYNTPEMPELLSSLKDEIADVFLYLDLLANHFGLQLEECIFPKFNAVSAAQEFPERLGDGEVPETRFIPGSPEAAKYLGTNWWRDSQGNTQWLDGREDIGHV